MFSAGKLTATRIPATMIVYAVSSLVALAGFDMNNPVTGDVESYEYKYVGSGTWTTADWKDLDGNNPAVVPQVKVSGTSVWSSLLIDGGQSVTSSGVEGWTFNLGLFNGSSLTISWLYKWQGGCNVCVDKNSKLTIETLGSGGYAGANFYVAASDGIQYNCDFGKEGSYNYYFAGEGSVSYKNLTGGTHTIKEADFRLSGSEQKSLKRKTLVSYTTYASHRTFYLDAAVKIRNSVGTALSSVAVSGSVTATSPTITVNDDVGTCQFVRSSSGTKTTIELYYVDGSTEGFSYTPSININFTYGGAALTTDANVGLEEYAVLGTAWNNVAAENGITSSMKKIDVTGAATVASGVSVVVSGSRGAYLCSDLSSGSDLRHGYIDDSNDNTTPTVTVYNIPFDNYRVVVYHATDTANVQFGYDTINGENYTYEDSYRASGTTSWGSSGPSDGAKPIAEGINTSVSGVISGSTLTIVAHRGSDYSVRGGIAAIQIVEVAVGNNDLLIDVSGDETYTVDADAEVGTVFLTGNGSISLAGSGKITAKVLDVGPRVAIAVDNDRLAVEDAVTGGGIVQYDGFLPSSDKCWTNLTVWSGTVQVRNITDLVGTSTSDGTYIDFNSYGNENSIFELTDVTGWINPNYTCNVPLKISGTLNLTDGHPNKAKAFKVGTLLGDGTIACDNKADTVVFNVTGDWSNFTGDINLSNKCVVFGETIPDTLAQGTIYVSDGASVSIAGEWTGSVLVGGAIGGTGTLTGSIAFATNSTFNVLSNDDDDGLVVSGEVRYPDDDSTVTINASGLELYGDVVLMKADNLKATKFKLAEGAPSESSLVVEDGALILRCQDIVEWTIVDGELISVNLNGATKAKIPDGVTRIGYAAFAYCSDLAHVTVPDSVTSVGDWAFYYCRSLVKVTFEGDAPTNVSAYAFYDIASGCEAVVDGDSTGWGVEEGESWNGLVLRYAGSSTTIKPDDTTGDEADDGGEEDELIVQLANTPYEDKLGSVSSGRYRIPALAKSADGVLVALYDCRYNNSSDLPNPIDAAENWSGDNGDTWTAPRIGIDVDNTNNYVKACNFGDPCILYNPADDKFWAMGITGGGLAASHSNGKSISDVAIYTRGTGRDSTWVAWDRGPAGNERSVKQMILDSLAEVEGDDQYKDEDNVVRGILQGPGHGMVQKKTVYASDGETVLMPAGAMVFPMQYFPLVSNWAYSSRAFAVYSSDGGITWTSTKLNPDDIVAQENCVMELDDGSWYMIAKGSPRQLFRSVDYINWTHSGSLSPSAWVQGSCLKIGEDSDGNSRYVACFAPTGDRANVTLHFGRDTTKKDPDGNGIEWDLGKRVVYPGSTGGMSYNSLVMLDETTLGILLESNGHIYFIREDIGDVLEKEPGSGYENSKLVVEKDGSSILISNTDATFDKGSWTISGAMTLTVPAVDGKLAEGDVISLDSITLGSSGISGSYGYATNLVIVVDGVNVVSAAAEIGNLTTITNSFGECSYTPCVYRFEDCRLVVGKKYSFALQDANGNGVSKVRYRLVSDVATIFDGFDCDSTWTPMFILSGEWLSSALPAHDSTYTEGTWCGIDEVKYVAGDFVDGVEVVSGGICQNLGEMATNSVAVCVLADLPANATGIIASFIVQQDKATFLTYAYANGDGTVSLGYDSSTNFLTSAVLDMSGLHLWSLAYDPSSGTKLYLDGEIAAFAEGLKWNGGKVQDRIIFGNATDGLCPLAGMTIYSVYTDFGSSSAIFDTVENGSRHVFDSFSFISDSAAAELTQCIEAFCLYAGDVVRASFDWTPGSAPMGWFTSWDGEAGGSPKELVGPEGTVTNLYATYYDGADDASKWIPYKDASAMDEFTFATYGSADAVEASKGKLAVLWCMGGKSAQKTALVKDDEGNIMLVQVSGTSATAAHVINAGKVEGYHLFTVRFSEANGASLQIDDGEVFADKSFTQVAGSGFQVGSVYGGCAAPFERGGGFAVVRMLAYSTDELSDAQYADLCRRFPPFEVTHECVLRISEIMPKPTDDQDPGQREGMDVNGLESGWVELENTSHKWADIADYRFIRVNRGKKTDPAGVGNFPSRLVPPRGRAIFYTSERYSNSKDKTVSAFAEGTFDGKPMVFADYGNILVWGDKVNPKKSPYVRLYYAPGGDSDNGTVVDTVVVPSDLPEGWSIIVGDAAEGEGTRRWMCPTPTRGTMNAATDGLVRIGPNVGPLYEKKGQKKTDFANEFAVPTPPAVPGTDYTVTLPINGVMNPDGSFTPRAADQIQSIKFVYRKDLDDATLVTNDINMATKTTVENWGDQYTATIPSDYFPEAGHLMQWKALITDGEGTEWTSPSFNNKDDGYEWYGTIVEPGELNSSTLPTWHMFAKEPHLTQMDRDKDKQNLNSVPNYARIAIYDSSTSNYYDYVRIDLRGNTSAGFTKKGHGLRFAKAHPLTMRDIVSGEDIEEIRKTSLISEFADPSYMRQMIAFWLWRKMGNLVPFDFPVRCNLNGEFYQLAFNSERFTDELIEDVYGLDKFGYSYKNVGTMKSGSETTAGSIEKKTPDDEDESNIDVLEDELRLKLKQYGAQNASEDTAALTKFVVQKFDLPAWLNYLASARITQEMDDVWGNVCAYYDNPDMLDDGARGTGTWMPLGYDFNLSFGQYYYNDIKDYGNRRDGLMANQDWYKSHPFYGGNRVVAYRNSSMSGAMDGNDGFESVLQSTKFRRLYLRRLRTLMDQELKEPGISSNEVPFMVEMRKMADLMRDDAALDQVKWPNNSTDNAIDVWATRPATMDAGIDDIWDNYVVPRREHLYVTHSVTNTAKAIGYGSNLNAGIPEAQSPISALAPNISIANLTALDVEQAEALGVTGQFYGTEVVVIRNDNAEVVDMSGWKLAFSVDFTFPAGTVCDANDSIYIVADRRAYIKAHDMELTDQVIVGNATFAGTGPIALYAADGTLVYAAIPQTNELKYLRLHSFYGNTLDGGDAGEWFTLTNISDSVTLDLADVTVCFLKQGDDHDTTDHCHVTLTNKKGKGDVNPLKSWTAQQADYSDKGWLKIQNNKQQITIYDKYGSVCQSLKVTQKTFPLAYGNGGYLVCDSVAASVTKDSDWHEALYELANDGGSSENFSAEDPAAANELVANAKPVLSDGDVAAGLEAQYLKVVAEPVEGESGKYKAVVVLDPETVAVPLVGGGGSTAGDEPVKVEDEDGGKKVSVSISNAIMGLWYGYEVADELSAGVVFGNDVDSFKRATNANHTVEGSPRTSPRGFFRVKVLPVKPQN